MTARHQSVAVVCPACGGGEFEPLYPDYSGPCITSDYAVLPQAILANRCCGHCGLIHNAAGTRGFTEDFYRESYSLMMRKENSAIQNFSGPRPISQAERSYNIFREMVMPAGSGRLLEAGAGKGDFLSHFVEGLRGWAIDAFEPSGAYETLRTRLPQANVTRGGYTDFPLECAGYDAVVALGVLEHVENPLDMLVWASARLREGGVFFIRVPNFANNPNDLFCADHLSKLTLPTLRAFGAAAGYDVLAEREDGVPFYIALRKSGRGRAAAMQGAFAENIPVARRNVAIAMQSMEAVATCRSVARQRGERFAIFGLGSSGLFAPFYGGFPASEIEAYVDENKTVWGSEVHGRPVRGLDVIPERAIKHIALAISPVYVAKVIEKLKPLGVEVYAAAAQ